MTPIKKTFLATFSSSKESFSSLFKHPRFLALSAASDLLFLFLYGFVTAPFIQKIVQNMVGFVQCLSKTTTNKSPWTFLGLIVAYVLVVYVLFVLFQGVSWWASSRLAGKKVPFKTYLGRFAKSQVLWYVLFVFAHALSYIMTLAAIAAQQTKNLGHLPFFTILFVILLYFSTISASLIATKKAGAAVTKTLVLGVGKIHRVLPSFALVVVLLYLVNLLVFAVSSLLSQSIAGRVFFVIIAGTIVLPFFCWIRTFLTRSLNNKQL